ncbi:MAG: SHOCT domain-containing protein [Candidatus Hydrothermarchaeales archaeon]
MVQAFAEMMMRMTPQVLSPWTMLFLFPFILLWLMGLIWATGNVLGRTDLDTGNKIVWLIVVWFFWVVGIVVYFLFGRIQRETILGEEKGSALRIMENRYAKGEIRREEYLKMKEDLTCK